MGRQLQVSFGSSTDNVKVVGYRLFRDGTAIATIDGLSFKQLLTLGKPGKSVLQLRAFDAAGNQSDPLVLTLTRLAAPKVPKVKPAWAWKLSRWQQAPTATRGIRPHTPNKLPKLVRQVERLAQGAGQGDRRLSRTNTRSRNERPGHAPGLSRSGQLPS